MDIFAHRGDLIFYAENTLSAIESALQKKRFNQGIVGVEIDTQVTKDGHMLVFHDKNFKHKGTAKDSSILNYPVSSLNAETIQQISLSEAGEPPPLLSQALNLINKYQARCLIEIKSFSNNREETCNALSKTLSHLDNKQRANITLISFDFSLLHLIKNDRILSQYAIIPILDKATVTKWVNNTSENAVSEKLNPFNGVNIEMGFYLHAPAFRKILNKIKEQKKQLICWPNFSDRNDNLYFYHLAKEIGMDSYTSDLPVDIILQGKRLKQLAINLGHVFSAYQFDQIQYGIVTMQHSQFGKLALYAPCEVDFKRYSLNTLKYKNSQKQLYKLIIKDIALLRLHTKKVLVSLKHTGSIHNELKLLFEKAPLKYHCILLDENNPQTPLNQFEHYVYH